MPWNNAKPPRHARSLGGIPPSGTRFRNESESLVMLLFSTLHNNLKGRGGKEEERKKRGKIPVKWETEEKKTPNLRILTPPGARRSEDQLATSSPSRGWCVCVCVCVRVCPYLCVYWREEKKSPPSRFDRRRIPFSALLLSSFTPPSLPPSSIYIAIHLRTKRTSHAPPSRSSLLRCRPRCRLSLPQPSPLFFFSLVQCNEQTPFSSFCFFFFILPRRQDQSRPRARARAHACTDLPVFTPGGPWHGYTWVGTEALS
ncbi:hypothetical protein DM02DRAFT_109340 [Periconia macrospinosa]|uniref:Uncharacterized protein n=1 Tax=Periconia macrospinosa TaxID=97972 RepID=A0A2V1E7B5_9PLEO|nr:hypothetical protein DM02DRAFT_109340 [Periconia macrospinosa]